jgi:PAS domain S-box-containing protein
MTKRTTRKTLKSPPRRRATPAKKGAVRKAKRSARVSVRILPETPPPYEAGVVPSAAKKRPLRVLIVEDLEDDAVLLARRLELGGYTVDYRRVETPQAMARALDSHPWDVILSDHSMPKFNAPEALALLKDRGLDVPFILVSGSIGEDQAVAIMKAGANDYLRKENLSRLLPVVEREIREADIRRRRSAAEEALRESESLYRTLVETSPDAVVVTDLELRVRMTNPQALRLLGVPSIAKLEGKRWVDIFVPEQEETLRRILQTLRRTERVEAAEVVLTPMDRPPFPAELSGSMLAGRRTQPDAILFLLRDISSRKEAEQQIRRQLDRLAGLRTIDAAITASMDLRVTLMVILDELTSRLQVDAADVLLLQSNSHSLRLFSGRGFRITPPKDLILPANHGYAGRVAMQRRPIVLPEWDGDGENRARAAALRSEGFVSYIAFPLIAKGVVKGVLEVFHRKRLDPDTTWLTYLGTIAGQAAIAIDNAMLFEDLQRTNVELTLAYDATIEGWSRALDLRDHETEGHTRRVTETTLRLARAVGMPEDDLIYTRRGCLLHDIGKMAIPDGILLKPGPLNEKEWEIMRRHPRSAYEWLSPIAFLRPSLDIPYCHHERWDGSGYPRRLRGEQIPLSARIFTLVDVWDALRSDRPYRPAWTDDRIRAYMESLEAIHFDPNLLPSFLEMVFD